MDDRKQEIPSLDLLRMELAREESRYEFWKTLRHIAGILAVAAAITALMVTRLFMLLGRRDCDPPSDEEDRKR